MAQAAGFGSALFKGVGAGLSAAGASYQGAQGVGYYNNMATMIQRDKTRAISEANIMRLQSSIAKDQAEAADNEAIYTRQMGAVKEERFKEETDSAIKAAISKLAASGVRVDYGSPMDFIDDVASKRSEDTALLQWSNRHDVYQKEMAAKEIHDKSTIMLTQAKLAEAELPMYDYQANLYRKAASEAEHAAAWKQMTAYFGAVIDVFGNGSNFNFFSRTTKDWGSGFVGNGSYLNGGVNSVTGQGW